MWVRECDKQIPRRTGRWDTDNERDGDREVHRCREGSRGQGGVKRLEAPVSGVVHPSHSIPHLQILWESVPLSPSTHTLFTVRGLLELHLVLLPSPLIKHHLLEASANDKKPRPVPIWTGDKVHYLVAVWEGDQSSFLLTSHIWMWPHMGFRKQKNPLNQYHNFLKCIKSMIYLFTQQIHDSIYIYKS